MLEDLHIHTQPKDPFRREVQILPRKAKKLSEMDLSAELLNNYQDAQDLLDSLDPIETPANQIAQVMNTINSIMRDIIKMQETVHNINNIKRLEAAIITALSGQSAEVKQAFLQAYEEAST